MKFHRRHNLYHSSQEAVFAVENPMDTKSLGADVHHMYICGGHVAAYMKMQMKLAQSNDIISTTIGGKNGEPKQMQETKERKEEVGEGGWTVVTCATVGKKTLSTNAFLWRYPGVHECEDHKLNI
nr:hypothetical protein [Tanacetum cinerariifolium]